ncbi:MAG: HNH endonuclease family protein, partial [Elusimicrobiota bacterium]
MIYLIRRRILSLTQGENKNIVLLVKKIEHIAKKELTMFDILSKLFYKLRLPNDDEVANRLKTVNFYEELKQYSKFILGKIEEHNSKVSVDFRDKRITIEHIMPRKLSNEWEAKLGEKWQEIHNNYLHNIGNIILTEFNSEIGNKSFEEKKEKLKESSLKYRLDVINEKNWNEKTIIKHQQKMIKRFLEVFAIPDKYKYSDNWISKTNNVDNIFSILDEEILDISTGSKPVELYLLGNKIKVNHWRDVFIEFLNYLRENEKEIFDFIIEKQS